jgi:thiamine-monophosphate kinase
VLMVTGMLGGSRGGKHLDFKPRLDEARAIRALIPDGVHACIDITDGLSRDLHHLCEESRVGAEVREEAIPFSPEARASEKSGKRSALNHALRDGEDFELLMAVEPRAAERLLKAWKLKTRLSIIGAIRPKKMGCTLVRPAGSRQNLADVGYEHRT